MGPQPGQPLAYAHYSLCRKDEPGRSSLWWEDSLCCPKYVFELVQLPPSPQLLLLGPRANETHFTLQTRSLHC